MANYFNVARTVHVFHLVNRLVLDNIRGKSVADAIIF